MGEDATSDITFELLNGSMVLRRGGDFTIVSPSSVYIIYYILFNIYIFIHIYV